MALKHTWVGHESVERIADIRLRCYGTKPTDASGMHKHTESERFVEGDVLIVSDDTGDIATAMSLSLQMNLRGVRVPCQGVAWVGTARSHRRRKVEGHGVASTVMRLMIERARERKQIASMLSPFRASFYEHFGYGLIERQQTWTIPLSILPRGDTDGFREATDAHRPAMLESRRRQFEQTHGDIETDARGLDGWLSSLAGSGFRMIDVRDGAVTSQFTLGTEVENNANVAVVHRPWWDSDAALLRLLAFLGTLKDQYSFARITLPTTVPLNWLLNERQVPHRRVDHPAATCSTVSRMQLRVLDHVSFLSALTIPKTARGGCTVAIRLGEGDMATLRLDFADGRIDARPATQSPDVTFTDTTWAAVAMGELSIRSAAAWGLIDVSRADAIESLQPLFEGPPPYCHDYF